MHQDELTFEFCDVRDIVSKDIRSDVLKLLTCVNAITADDLASVCVGNRSRNVIGGVLNGMVRSRELRVTGRVASQIKANHRRYVNQYALANNAIDGGAL